MKNDLPDPEFKGKHVKDLIRDYRTLPPERRAALMAKLENVQRNEKSTPNRVEQHRERDDGRESR